MTRGGSQEDPQQLLRDLQDSLEREADLREQLRFAEEEVKFPVISSLKEILRPRERKTLNPAIHFNLNFLFFSL